MVEQGGRLGLCSDPASPSITQPPDRKIRTSQVPIHLVQPQVLLTPQWVQVLLCAWPKSESGPVGLGSITTLFPSVLFFFFAGAFFLPPSAGRTYAPSLASKTTSQLSWAAVSNGFPLCRVERYKFFLKAEIVWIFITLFKKYT